MGYGGKGGGKGMYGNKGWHSHGKGSWSQPSQPQQFPMEQSSGISGMAATFQNMMGDIRALGEMSQLGSLPAGGNNAMQCAPPQISQAPPAQDTGASLIDVLSKALPPSGKGEGDQRHVPH